MAADVVPGAVPVPVAPRWDGGPVVAVPRHWQFQAVMRKVVGERVQASDE